MNQKKGLLPVIVLLIGCVLLTMWVWKQETQTAPAEIRLDALEMQSLLADGKPVLLNLSSDDCPYCVMMEPELAQVYREYGDVVTIREINVDEVPEVAMQLPVRATPTQVLFYADGRPYVPNPSLLTQMTFLYYSTQNQIHVLTVHEGYLDAAQMEQIILDLEGRL